MNEYKNLIDEFEDLNIKDKREEINAELKELFAIFHVLMLEKGINETPLLHPEMDDNDTGTEDDFLNSTYAYIMSIKESIGRYFNE